MESYRDQVRSIVALFGSNRRAAEFLGVSHSQLPGWLATSVPSTRSLQRIVDSAAVLKALRTYGLSDDQILTELSSIWPELAGRRPAALVATGAANDVISAAAARYADMRPGLPSAAPDLAETLRALAAAAAASAAALARGAS